MADKWEQAPERGDKFRRGDVREVRPGFPIDGEELPEGPQRRPFAERRPMLAFAMVLALGDVAAMVPSPGLLALVGPFGVALLLWPRPLSALFIPLLCALLLSFLRGIAVQDSTERPTAASVVGLDEEIGGRLHPQLGIWSEGPQPSLSGLSPWRLSLPQPRDAAGVLDWSARAPQLAHSGEAVALLPGDAPLLRAEGPVPGAWTANGTLGSVRVLPDSLQRLAPANRTLLELLFTKLRPNSPRSVLIARSQALDAGLPRGLLGALLFGSKTGVDPAAKDLFTRTGTRHLLAISGLHVGLLAIFLILPVARMLARLVALLVGQGPSGAKLAAPIGIALVVLFVPLAGAAPPVLRASAALILGLAAPHFGPLGRRPDSLNLWGVALVIENLARPAAMADLSVRLSYLATLGLILTLGSLASRLPGARSSVSVTIEAPSIPKLILARANRSLRFALAASLAAVWITLPVTWSIFGELAPIGILLTPLAVPLIAWILTIAWPLVLLLPVLDTLHTGLANQLMSTLVAPAGHALGALLSFADNMPGTPIPLPPRPEAMVALCTGLGIFALLQHRNRARSGTLESGCPFTIAACLLGVLLVLPWSTAPSKTQVLVANVGHGTAALVRLPSGAVWVFDGGSRDRLRVAAEALLPQLAKWDGPRPHYVLSHNDFDHRSALPRMIERHPPQSWTGHLPSEFRERLPADCAIRDVGMGSLHLASEASTDLILVRGSEQPGNEGSRTLVVEAKTGRFLLWGDAEEEGLAGILAQLPAAGQSPKPTVLLLPHHGSETSLLSSLLQVVQPTKIWVSGSAPPQLGPELHRRGFVVSETRLSGTLLWSP